MLKKITKCLARRRRATCRQRISVSAALCLSAVFFSTRSIAQTEQLANGKGRLAPRCVSFSPGGNWLLAAGSRCVVWDLTKKPPAAMPLKVPGFALAASYSPDGRHIAVLSVERPEGAEGNEPSDFLPAVISLYDGKSRKLIRQLHGHEESNRLEIMSLAWFPDSRRLATSANQVLLWDVESGRRIAEAENLLGRLAVCPDGKSLFAFGRSQTSIVRWDIEAKKETLFFSGRRELFELALSPDGKWAAFSDDHRAQVHSVDGRTKYSMPERAMALAFSWNSETLAMGGGKENETVDLWSMDRREFIKRIPAAGHPTTLSLAFSPDNKQLARAAGTFLSGHIDAFSGDVTLIDARISAPQQ